MLRLARVKYNAAYEEILRKTYGSIYNLPQYINCYAKFGSRDSYALGKLVGIDTYCVTFYVGDIQSSWLLYVYVDDSSTNVALMARQL